MSRIDSIRSNKIKIVASFLAGLICAFSTAISYANLWLRRPVVQVGLLIILTIGFSLAIYVSFEVMRKKLTPLNQRRLGLYGISWLFLFLIVYRILFISGMDASKPPLPRSSHELEITVGYPVDNQLPNGQVTLIKVTLQGLVQPLRQFKQTGEWINGANHYPNSLSTSGPAKLKFVFNSASYQIINLIFLKCPGCGNVNVRVDNTDKIVKLSETVNGETNISFRTDNQGLTLAFGSVDNIASIILTTLVLVILGIVYQGFTRLNRRWRAFIFALVYLIIVVIIKLINAPDTLFYFSGGGLSFYYAARFVFMVYLLIIFYSFGKFFFKLLKIPLNFKDTLDFPILYLFIGSSILNLFMFILGLANGYYLWSALFVTVPLVYLSYPDVSGLYGLAKHYLLARIRNLKMQGVSISPARLVYGLLVLTAIIEGVALLFVQGLSPDNDGDVATHYMPYYETVIRNHGISPNTVWYHFYYSNGNGLFFLSNLLSDKYGAQLISILYMFFSVLVLYSVLKAFSESRILRWFILSVVISIFLGTSGINNYPVSFSRLHIIELAGLAFSLWVAVKLICQHEGKGRLFFIICGIALIGLLIFSTKNVIFLLPYSFAVLLWLFFHKKVDESKSALIIFLMLSATQVGMMAYNYFMTGMYEDIPIRTMWNLTNQHTFSQWVSPYMMLYLLEGSAPALGTSTWNLPSIYWYFGAFRIDKIFLLPFPWNWSQWLLFDSLVVALVVCAVIAYRKSKNLFQEKFLLFFLSAVVIGDAILIPAISPQLISLDRTYIITSFFMILLFVGLWEMGPALILQQRTLNRLLNIILIIGWIWIVFQVNNGIFPLSTENGQTTLIPNPTVLRAINFLSGNLSYAQFTHTGDAGYKDYYQAHLFVGQDQRILSLNHSYALPGRDIEREIDYAYRDWHVMAFGQPEDAKHAFQREGLNYFILSIDSKKPLVPGALPYSPIFNPDNIQNNFDVIWKSNETYLITWKGTSLQSLGWDKKFLESYKAKVAKEGLPELYERVLTYYQKYGTNYPVYPDKTLQPVKGWQ